ncbi:MAG: hypothetical protein R3211_01880, partial [Balneolaceae bacterium]|nr:hypothetical protein [Balneolaceae bacterium]
MRKLLQFMRPLIKWDCRHPFLVVGISLVLAAVAGYFALQLSIDTDIANLLPKNNEYVTSLEKLQNTVGGEQPMQVAIKSPSFEANKEFAAVLIDRSMELYYDKANNFFFERAEFKKDTEILKDNALYLATHRELEEVKSFLEKEIQEAKEEANPFFIDLEEDEETADDGGDMDRFEETYQALIPSEYPVNEDSTVMVINFYPTGSKSNLTYLRDMFAAYDSLLTTMQPAQYHPEMEVLHGGRLQRHLNEIDSVMSDVFNSFASGISGVILLVIIYFSSKKYLNYRRGEEADQKHGIWHHILRTPVPMLVIGIPLLIS